MSRIDELIRELCPEGARVTSLPEVASVVRGLTYSKSDEDPSGAVRVLRANNIDAESNTVNLSDLKSLRSDMLIDEKFRLRASDILISTASGSRSHVGKVAFIERDLLAYFGGFMAAIRSTSQINPRFLFHILTGKNFRDHLDSALSTSTINNINSTIMRGFHLPVPPLEVQREIVSILDKFTQLEAELEAELETRQRQFAVYSDQLLSDLGLDNASVPFGDVATIKRGASPRPISKFISNEEGAVPWIKIGDVSQGSKFITKTKEKVSQEGAAKSRVIQPGDFLLSNSMSFGRPYISKISGCIHDGWLSISEFEEHLDSDFLFHILNSNRIQTEFRRRAGSGTVKNLNAEIVKNVSLPLPPLSLQREIARALDTFEKFTSDSADGLPAEISARRKQYEYYRNKLLTFKELDAA